MFLLPGTVCAESETVSIALQPFGKLDTVLLEDLTKGIKRQFKSITVDIRPAIGLPKSAYYKPRKRYRAVKLIRYLDQYYQLNGLDGYSRILGITTRDISVTQDGHYDKGVAGYAVIGRGPCVVSTNRLIRKRERYPHFLARVLKTIIHELGHTFGLEHCPTQDCVMQKIKMIRRINSSRSIQFCGRCRPTLGKRFDHFKE